MVRTRPACQLGFNYRMPIFQGVIRREPERWNRRAKDADDPARSGNRKMSWRAIVADQKCATVEQSRSLEQGQVTGNAVTSAANSATYFLT
jgi:hypothetical protein